MKTQSRTQKIRLLVFTAVLAAVILIMALTPLGYLRAGAVSITFLMIPVMIGAILFGPTVGLILGLIFGATSFAQCFGILSYYGVDAFGAACFSLNPIGTIVMCFVPRMLLGFSVYWIFRLFHKLFLRLDKSEKHNAGDIVALAVSNVLGAVIHTVVFIGFFLLFFRNADFSAAFGDGFLLSKWNLIDVIAILFTTNAIIEWVVCGIVGTAICKALLIYMKKHNPNQAL